MIVFCGEALIDMVPETTSDGRGVYAPCYGGGPYNTAIAAGRLLGTSGGKRRAAFLNKISLDFFGEELVRNLERNNVSAEFLVRSPEAEPLDGETTVLGFVKLEPGKDNEYIFYTVGSAMRSFSKSELPAALPPQTRALMFGSISLTMEPSASTIESLIKREREKNPELVISLDPNVRPMMISGKAAYVQRFESWLKASTILKLSDADLDFIYPGVTIEEAVGRIFAAPEGPLLIAVTLGKDGAAVYLRENGGTKTVVKEPVVDLPVVDTIGAGDTFHGALLSWFEMKDNLSRSALAKLSEAELRQAVVFANKAASIVCSRKGANPPTLAEVEAL